MRRLLWLAIFFAGLAWSAWEPKDRLTWWLEVAPALLALTILALTQRHYPATRLTACLLLAHCLILMVGGHYTYAEVPLFDQLAAWTGGTRNNFDKLGHFAQGFVPAIIAREVLLRAGAVNGRLWLNLFVVCFCLAVSAFYELIEWWVALLSEQAADAFLGTQGYVWDTQSDMFWALIGTLAALVLLARRHDRQLAALNGGGGR